MYKLVFEKKALHELNKLEAKTKERIWKKLHDSKEYPFRFFEKLTETAGFKLRVEDWRVVADILTNKEAIVVLKVGHRRNVYDK